MNKEKAQDNKRENLQKQIFDLTEEHKRDKKYDAYHKMNIEFKSKHVSKACTTKRRYKSDPFGNCVMVVSEYEEKDSLTGEHYIIFPPALKEWREEQERKLKFDNGTIPCYDDIEYLKSKSLPIDGDPRLEEILEKCKNQVHRNDPAIPKRFFDTEGFFTSINRKKTETQYPNYFFKVPTDCDPPVFLREKIDWYLKSDFNK